MADLIVELYGVRLGVLAEVHDEDGTLWTSVAWWDRK